MSELSAGLFQAPLDEAWESASWAGNDGVGDGVPLLASLREAHAEAATLRAALADGGLDLLEIRGAYARTLSSLRGEIATRDAALAARDDESLRVEFAHEAALEAARTHMVELEMRLDAAIGVASVRAEAVGAGHAECDRALALACAEVAAVRSSEEAARAGESAATEDCAVLADALRARAADAVAARAETDIVSARARALAEQLAQVVMSGAGDAVRADEAEAARNAAERALAKREAQLLKVVEALKVVREREALANAALDAQAASLAAATGAESSAIAAAARWHAMATQSAVEAETAWQAAASARAQATQLEASRSISAEVLAEAEKAGAAVRDLATALALAQEEKERIVAALSDSRSDRARADAAAARRAADADALVAGLAADLSAANAALATAGAASGHDFGRVGGVRGNARKVLVPPMRQQVAVGMGRVGVQGGLGGAAGPPGGAAMSSSAPVDPSDANSELGRQVESLSRALVRARERAAAVEAEADELLDVNERLRVTLENARDESIATPAPAALDAALQLAAELNDRGKRLKGTAALRSEDATMGGGGAGAVVGEGGATATAAAAASLAATSAALVAHAIECESAFAAIRKLVAAAQALAAGVRAQFSLKTVEGGGEGSARDTAAVTVGDAIDAAAAIARAQTMNSNMPAREVLLAALGAAAADTGAALPRGQALFALGLSTSLTRAPLFARLVGAATGAVEGVIVDMRARAADTLGEACAMQ